MGTRRVSTPNGEFTLFYSIKSPFSNFYRCYFEAVDWDGKKVKCSCVEQYNKALSCGDTIAAKIILNLDDPKQVKRIGSQLDGFVQTTWDRIKEEIMKRALKAKFSQDEELRKLLFMTQGSQLVECSPMDKVWGVGLAIDSEEVLNPELWQGTNKLGKAMESIRNSLWIDDKYSQEKQEAEEALKIEGFALEFFKAKCRYSPEPFTSIASYPTPIDRPLQKYNKFRKDHHDNRRKGRSQSRSPRRSFKRSSYESPERSVKRSRRSSRSASRDRSYRKHYRRRRHSRSRSYSPANGRKEKSPRGRSSYRNEKSHQRESSYKTRVDTRRSSGTPDEAKMGNIIADLESKLAKENATKKNDGELLGPVLDVAALAKCKIEQEKEEQMKKEEEMSPRRLQIAKVERLMNGHSRNKTDAITEDYFTKTTVVTRKERNYSPEHKKEHRHRRSRSRSNDRHDKDEHKRHRSDSPDRKHSSKTRTVGHDNARRAREQTKRLLEQKEKDARQQKKMETSKKRESRKSEESKKVVKEKDTQDTAKSSGVNKLLSQLLNKNRTMYPY